VFAPRASRRALLVAAAAAGRERTAARDAAPPRLVITEIMADPAAVPDERGEWFELYNPGGAPVSLRGWTIASGNDAPHPIARPAPYGAGDRRRVRSSAGRKSFRRSGGVEGATVRGVEQ